ncbi:MAG: hypothetical protein HY962_06235 [Ignavibacteriae bacterium]|nr:hypothetical protein [Ignavibacteriota bacterium]
MRFSMILFFLLATVFALQAQDQMMSIVRSVPGCPDSTNTPRLRDGFSSAGDRRSALDINGDGIPDQGFYFEADGLTEKLVVVDGATPTRRWEFTLWSGATRKPYSHRLIGYYNLDGIVDNGNPKEPVFASARGDVGFKVTFEDVVISSYTLQTTQPLGIIAILIGLFDANGDGRTDILTASCNQPSGSSMDLWSWK